MPKRVCYDVEPFADHWIVTAEGVAGTDRYASMFAALLVAHEAARVRWAELDQPSRVRAKIHAGSEWATTEDYG